MKNINNSTLLVYQILQKFNIVGPKEKKKVIEQSLLINSQYEEFNCKS